MSRAILCCHIERRGRPNSLDQFFLNLAGPGHPRRNLRRFMVERLSDDASDGRSGDPQPCDLAAFAARRQRRRGRGPGRWPWPILASPAAEGRGVDGGPAPQPARRPRPRPGAAMAGAGGGRSGNPRPCGRRRRSTPAAPRPRPWRILASPAGERRGLDLGAAEPEILDPAAFAADRRQPRRDQSDIRSPEGWDRQHARGARVRFTIGAGNASGERRSPIVRAEPPPDAAGKVAKPWRRAEKRPDFA